MNQVILSKLHTIPADVDLVVGIPRSGLIPASIIGLALNKPIADLAGFLENRRFASGTSRKADSRFPNSVYESKHVLVVDDSIGTGHSLANVKDRIKNSNIPDSIKITYAVAYAAPATKDQVDIAFEVVKMPRIFDWNIFHVHAQDICFDIDGVLCHDPSVEQNDDGPKYREFLSNATPLIQPHGKLGYLVTSRLEKYRSDTEQWMKASGIEFGELHMLNLDSAEERRRTQAHVAFKAKTYQRLSGARLFIESEVDQAKRIAQLSGKKVYCAGNGTMYYPGTGLKTASNEIANFTFRIKRKLKQIFFQLKGK
ncbi:hypothetical protein LOC67_12965 [Stieleria sp. JC731]|uniref:phosphoribosyltransferase family protein n=1 Tax=Pirellulaceae TaxID=2691357 RepID=UPI001E5BAE11|nr:phosphoribosyltransferase family protein [Stieleria sp. JC731]MCC9601460.1 hypothetical protein [Stieleria sp. JC731]